MRPFILLTLFTAAAALAGDRPELSGTWQLSSDQGKLKFETLLIQQTSDGVKITESGGAKKPMDFACGTDAQECKVKERKFSFWYNGPALVMMESNVDGDVVTKTRLVPATDGKTLSLEVERILPQGPTATYTFRKQ